MQAVKAFRQFRWTTIAGVGLFMAMMATGYYYNVTFIQLGLLDLGTRHLGLASARVTGLMAMFALVTFTASAVAATVMTRLGWGARMRTKLRIAAGVAAAQAVLTFASAWIAGGATFTLWLIVAGLIMGLGITATFGLTVDLIPVRDRGGVAAVITAIAYFAAPIASYPWTFEHLRAQMLPVVAGGAIVVIVLGFVPNPLVDMLAIQSAETDFGIGRFAPQRGGGGTGQLLMLAALMFGAFFVDSLGFLRLSEEAVYMQGAWLSDDSGVRLFIGLMHVLGAWIAGVFYSAFGYRTLFLWTFGLFGLVHLLYTFPLRIGDPAPVLLQPMVYALAVSIYTVLNFALWADLSTPETVARNAAIGVGFSGWTATFISTGLALAWRESGMDMTLHLQIVDAMAIMLFLGLLIAIYFQPWSSALITKEAS